MLPTCYIPPLCKLPPISVSWYLLGFEGSAAGEGAAAQPWLTAIQLQWMLHVQQVREEASRADDTGEDCFIRKVAHL